MEKTLCATCKKQFTIRDADRNFYEQVKASLPVHCPDCRYQRRLAFRNERTLYKRPCDMCKKPGISLFPESFKGLAYCHDCWWGDGWDPKSFAMDYDPKRPFFDQFKELLEKVPRIKLNLVGNNVRSEYTNNSGDNKDCYLVFAAEQNEECLYGRLVQHCKSCVDCAFVYDSELCYECVDVRQSHKVMFSERCQTSSDLLFCFDCRDCQNCIFSTNQRHATYMIENKKCTKEEYEKKKAEILASHASIEEAKRKFEKMKEGTIVKFAFQTKCNDATGDYLFNCHESARLFDASNAKHCAYLCDAEDPIDCWDGNNMYYKPELCLDMMGILQSYECKHCAYVFYCSNIEYCDSCHNLNDAIGCVAIRKGQNMILNKEYSSEEFQKLRGEIIESLKKEGTYGQFIPPTLSAFGYNETLAKDFFPLSRDEAIAKGFRWQEQATGTFGKETIEEKDIPETISQITDDALSDIFSCKECGKNYRLTKMELEFYRRMGIPVPHSDFECRHQARMAKRTPRALWKRECMCDKEKHEHTGKCPNIFETAYSPDRPEKVYCEKCYQQEVL